MSREQDSYRGRRHRRSDNRENRDNKDAGNRDASKNQSGKDVQAREQGTKNTFVIPQAPKRDYEPCPISGKPIENPLTAIVHRESEKPADFDTVLEMVKSHEHLGPREFVCYIGAGNFAVYEEVEQAGKKTLVLKKKIPYEEHHQKPDWRRELSPGISKDYKPSPESLSTLYSPEEERNFPKLGTAATSYMPKNI